MVKFYKKTNLVPSNFELRSIEGLVYIHSKSNTIYSFDELFLAIKKSLNNEGENELTKAEVEKGLQRLVHLGLFLQLLLD